MGTGGKDMKDKSLETVTMIAILLFIAAFTWVFWVALPLLNEM